MKKLVFSAMAFALVIASCEKEEALVEVENTETQNNRMLTGSGMRFYWENPAEQSHGCTGNGNDCYPNEIVSHVDHLYTTVSGVNNLINPLVSGPYPSTELSDYFTAHQADLELIIAPDLVAGIIDESLTLRSTGDLTIGSEYFLVFEDDSGIHMVQPLSITD